MPMATKLIKSMREPAYGQPRSGSARVNLATGEGSFAVDGLVLNGSSASGTPGPINSVVGTLVCNPGTATQAILDTPATDLSPRGNTDLLAKPLSCATGPTPTPKAKRADSSVNERFGVTILPKGDGPDDVMRTCSAVFSLCEQYEQEQRGGNRTRQVSDEPRDSARKCRQARLCSDPASYLRRSGSL
jgi:hypothetical protein